MINYLDYRYSNNKGEAKKGQVFNSALNKLASDYNYTSNFVEGEVVTLTQDTTTTSTYTGILAWQPAIDGSCRVKIGNTYFDATIADGKVTATGLPTTGVTEGTVDGYYYDNETVQSDLYDANGKGAWGTNVPEVELRMNSIPVEARARTLRSYWAFDAQYELQKEYGQDINVQYPLCSNT